ncbi:MAG: threonine synthase [Chloroflexi bacterium]|nr:threonine synthase [Chloroflexota bacterium]
MRFGVVQKYRSFLPVNPGTPLITLGEGDTPLVQSTRIAREIGCDQLYFKLEGCNPTGSFKDRGMVMAVAKAIEEGSKAIICASTGNTSASAAAYAAHCGLAAAVVVPSGYVALGKLTQALMHGAQVLAIEGNFDQALQMVRTIVGRHPITLVNSLNPYRLEGQKTAAFEVVDALGAAPDYLFIPVGNAGNITAYWRGFVEYRRTGKSDSLPRMMGFEAEGAAAIVRGKPVAQPTTIATAIRIGNPASWRGAEQAREESGGLIDAIADDAIIEAYHLLANGEGLFVEPASAAGVAGLLKLARRGQDFSGKTVVCVLTGSGLKDPDTAMKTVPGMVAVPADVASIEKELGY